MLIVKCQGEWIGFIINLQTYFVISDKFMISFKVKGNDSDFAVSKSLLKAC